MNNHIVLKVGTTGKYKFKPPFSKHHDGQELKLISVEHIPNMMKRMNVTMGVFSSTVYEIYNFYYAIIYIFISNSTSENNI